MSDVLCVECGAPNTGENAGLGWCCAKCEAALNDDRKQVAEYDDERDGPIAYLRKFAGGDDPDDYLEINARFARVVVASLDAETARADDAERRLGAGREPLTYRQLGAPAAFCLVLGCVEERPCLHHHMLADHSASLATRKATRDLVEIADAQRDAARADLARVTEERDAFARCVEIAKRLAVEREKVVAAARDAAIEECAALLHDEAERRFEHDDESSAVLGDAVGWLRALKERPA